MHLARRAYVLAVLTALLAIVGLWSSDPVFAGVWRWPAALLLLGLTLEAVLVRRTPLQAAVEAGDRAFLGRAQPAAFTFANPGSRDLQLEYAPVTPAGVEPLGPARRVRAPGAGSGRDPFTLVPVRLGLQAWPALPARVLGRLGLAWWSRELAVAQRLMVAPDTRRMPRGKPSGVPAGMRPRRALGAGSELHQLRAYVPGDPLARIDWKASARTRRLVSREFTEDQHLDILIGVDAGRLSRVRAGILDRLGLYANIAARFAEAAVPHDDRIGLLVFSDRTLAVCPPARGLPAVARIRRTLERLATQPTETDPVAAATRIRALLKHRSLVVLLTDLDDMTAAEQLARAVRVLSPPHVVLIAGVVGEESAELARREARGWRDPWIALAAQEHEARGRRDRELLRRLGAPVVATREDLLEDAVLARYESLRRARRI